MKRLSAQEQIAYLSEPTGTWGYKEIMSYFNVSYGKANTLMRHIEEQKGVLPCYMGKTRRRIKIEDILNLYGTTRNNELDFILKLKEIKNKK